MNNNHFLMASEYAKKFMRDIQKKVYSTPALNNMLNVTSEINYAVEYHLRDKDDGILVKISSLIEELEGDNVSNKRKTEIYNEIKELEPSEDIKYIILIERLIANSENYNFGIGVEEESSQPLCYNGFYWEPMTVPLVKEFLAEIATMSGFHYYYMRLTKNLNRLYEQFVNLATLPTYEVSESEVKINLQNGTFVVTKERQWLKDFDKSDFFKYQLPFEYNQESTCPTFLNFLNEVLPEKESQMILSEYLGYVFIKGLKLEKCLILYGTGSNGKSVVFDIVSALLGNNNICNYSLSNLCNDNGYARASLENFLLNYSSEIGGTQSSADTIKKLISNEPIEARFPYGKPFILRDYCKFMFNANTLPREKEYTHAYWRRFILLNFDVTIEDSKQDKGLANKIIATELSGIFNWVLEGLYRLLKNENFTESTKSNELLENVKKESDYVALFLDSKGYMPSGDIAHKISLAQLRKEFEAWCHIENITYTISPNQFWKRLEFHKYTMFTGSGGQRFTMIKDSNPFNTFEKIEEL